MKLKCVRKLLIIKEILVEAAGFRLFAVLTPRKLLIPGNATPAKKAPLPDPFYVYCTKMLSLQSPANSTQWSQYDINSPVRIGKNSQRD
jgi:hypothetical protein